MCVWERICLCEIEWESVLESSRNRKSKKKKKKELEKERERDSYEKIILNKLEKEKEGR